MLGDFVKGKNYLKFPPLIQKGILLHRAIDRWTDEHPLVFEATAFFKPEFRLSAGVFTDIFFDHFLANDVRYFTEAGLLTFTEETYHSLQSHQDLLDDKMLSFFGYMKQYNWLFHYRSIEGVAKSVNGMCQRHPRLGDASHALKIFETHYEPLRLLYTEFFPLLFEKSRLWLVQENKNH